MLQAKDKPTYCPNRDDGDICIVLNAKEIGFTGRKLTDKFYRWHTGQVAHFLLLLLWKRFITSFLASISHFLLLFINLLISLYRYIGHLKERSLKDQMAKDPTEVIRKAVWRMLPSNNLRNVSTLLSETFSNHLNPQSFRFLTYWLQILPHTLALLLLVEIHHELCGMRFLVSYI